MDEELIEIFDELDVRGRGKLSLYEVYDYNETELDPPLHIEHVRHVMEQCCDNPEECTRDEFPEMVRELFVVQGDFERWSWDFRLLDPTNSGTISLENALAMIRLNKNPDFSKEDWQRFLHTRVNPDAPVNLTELCEFLLTKPQRGTKQMAADDPEYSRLRDEARAKTLAPGRITMEVMHGEELEESRRRLQEFQRGLGTSMDRELKAAKYQWTLMHLYPEQRLEAVLRNPKHALEEAAAKGRILRLMDARATRAMQLGKSGEYYEQRKEHIDEHWIVLSSPEGPTRWRAWSRPEARAASDLEALLIFEEQAHTRILARLITENIASRRDQAEQLAVRAKLVGIQLPPKFEALPHDDFVAHQEKVAVAVGGKLSELRQEAQDFFNQGNEREYAAAKARVAAFVEQLDTDVQRINAKLDMLARESREDWEAILNNLEQEEEEDAPFGHERARQARFEEVKERVRAEAPPDVFGAPLTDEQRADEAYMDKLNREVARQKTLLEVRMASRKESGREVDDLMARLRALESLDLLEDFDPLTSLEHDKAMELAILQENYESEKELVNAHKQSPTRRFSIPQMPSGSQARIVQRRTLVKQLQQTLGLVDVGTDQPRVKPSLRRDTLDSEEQLAAKFEAEKRWLIAIFEELEDVAHMMEAGRLTAREYGDEMIRQQTQLRIRRQSITEADKPPTPQQARANAIKTLDREVTAVMSQTTQKEESLKREMTKQEAQLKARLRGMNRGSRKRGNTANAEAAEAQAVVMGFTRARTNMSIKLEEERQDVKERVQSRVQARKMERQATMDMLDKEDEDGGDSPRRRASLLVAGERLEEEEGGGADAAEDEDEGEGEEEFEESAAFSSGFNTSRRRSLGIDEEDGN